MKTVEIDKYEYKNLYNNLKIHLKYLKKLAIKIVLNAIKIVQIVKKI